jgi:hypothetical protein
MMTFGVPLESPPRRHGLRQMATSEWSAPLEPDSLK